MIGMMGIVYGCDAIGCFFQKRDLKTVFFLGSLYGPLTVATQRNFMIALFL